MTKQVGRGLSIIAEAMANCQIAEEMDALVDCGEFSHDPHQRLWTMSMRRAYRVARARLGWSRSKLNSFVKVRRHRVWINRAADRIIARRRAR